MPGPVRLLELPRDFPVHCDWGRNPEEGAPAKRSSSSSSGRAAELQSRRTGGLPELGRKRG